MLDWDDMRVFLGVARARSLTGAAPGLRMDPATGLSFCYLTNGIDAHLFRQWRRGPSLSNRATACAR